MSCRHSNRNNSTIQAPVIVYHLIITIIKAHTHTNTTRHTRTHTLIHLLLPLLVSKQQSHTYNISHMSMHLKTHPHTHTFTLNHKFRFDFHLNGCIGQHCVYAIGQLYRNHSILLCAKANVLCGDKNKLKRNIHTHTQTHQTYTHRCSAVDSCLCCCFIQILHK